MVEPIHVSVQNKQKMLSQFYELWSFCSYFVKTKCGLTFKKENQHLCIPFSFFLKLEKLFRAKMPCINYDLKLGF